VPIEVSPFTKVLMDQAQLVAIAFMAVVYAMKVRWLLRFKASVERTPARGSEARGVRFAMTTIAMPWELPSTRTHWVRWVEFAVFHVGVAAAIGLTFVMPYWPSVVQPAPVVLAVQLVFGVAALAALSRLWRRLARPEMRLITSPDDFFSLALLIAWLVAGILAAPQRSEPSLVAFFGLTAFFLVYVPFSKISHYIYWPLIRYYVGRHLGHRGAYPTKTVPRHA
jgi:nitrate reductase gamma subunit